MVLTGNSLKYLRKKYKLKQTDIMEATGACRMTVSRWENGVYNISPEYKKILLTHFENLKKKKK